MDGQICPHAAGQCNFSPFAVFPKRLDDFQSRPCPLFIFTNPGSHYQSISCPPLRRNRVSCLRSLPGIALFPASKFAPMEPAQGLSMFSKLVPLGDLNPYRSATFFLLTKARFINRAAGSPAENFLSLNFQAIRAFPPFPSRMVPPQRGRNNSFWIERLKK